MRSRMMLVAAGAVIALHCPLVAGGYEYDAEATTKIMMEMVSDLGGHDAVHESSGKTMRCSYGGTRKVSITREGSTATYSGDYRNCREKGSIRDGLYKIVIDGEEIVSSTSWRSINGELFDAARQGDVGRVRKLIKAKADVNYAESIRTADGGNIDDMTPLMLATMAGSLETVKLLVSNGAWVNYLNGRVVNSLWIAAHNGNLEIVKYLAKRGAYVNNRNFEDVTPLMAAATNGHVDVVRFLIAAKANLNFAHKEGDTALMFALANGHTEIVRLLVAAGADVNLRNRFGVTALHVAVAEGNVEGAKLLLGRKADATAKTTSGLTALDVARGKGIAEIVKLLEN